MAGDDIRKDVRELREQIEALRAALESVARPYSEIAGVVDQLRSLTGGYFRILDVIQRFGGVGADLAVPRLEGDISRHVLAVLNEGGGPNVVPGTGAVKARRGNGSEAVVGGR